MSAGDPGAEARPKFAYAGVGLLAGFIAGLFGLGGGVLISPGLMLLGGIPQRLAHGTALATSAFLAAAGIAGYALSDSIDVPAAMVIFAGSWLGVLLGADLLSRIRIRTLQGVFVVLLGVTAGRLLAGIPAGTGEVSLTAATGLALAGVGLLAGLLAGLLGIGGGVIVVPALVLLFGMMEVTAKGTSLMVVLPTAIIGTLRNMRHQNVDLRGALLTSAGGVSSAFGGALLAGVIPSRISTGLFAGLLLLIAVRMVSQLLRSAPAPPKSPGATRRSPGRRFRPRRGSDRPDDADDPGTSGSPRRRWFRARRRTSRPDGDDPGTSGSPRRRWFRARRGSGRPDGADDPDDGNDGASATDPPAGR